MLSTACESAYLLPFVICTLLERILADVGGLNPLKHFLLIAMILFLKLKYYPRERRGGSLTTVELP